LTEQKYEKFPTFSPHLLKYVQSEFIW